MVIDFYEQQKKNIQKTILLVAVMLILIFVVGIILDYYFETNGLITLALLVVSGIQLLIAFFSGSKIVLSSVGARKVEENTENLEERQLYNIVSELRISSGLDMPEVYVMDDPSINAFATGIKKNKSYVCTTTGLLKHLNREETEGVIAHELSHIKNRDVLLMTMISALVGGVLLLSIIAFRSGFMLLRGSAFSGTFRKKDKDDSQGAMLAFVLALLTVGAVMFLIGQVSRLMNLAISRKREFLADATAVEFTRNPNGLASALKKIKSLHTPTKKANAATASLFISEPIKMDMAEKSGFLANLFSTHPPITERIKKLLPLP